MLRAAIFDLDGTLYDYASAHETGLRVLAAFCESALDLPPARFMELHDAIYRRQRARGGPASHSRLIRFQLMLEGLGRPIGLAPVMEKLYWNAMIADARVLPGAAGTLDGLREMGLSVGVGTNMTADWQFEKLMRLDLLRRIDFMVTSEEVGVEKPDARLFELCAGKAGCAPSDCVFVGDSLKSDALGARDAGMRAVWLCSGPDDADPPTGVTRIRALSELPDLLTSM